MKWNSGGWTRYFETIRAGDREGAILFGKDCYFNSETDGTSCARPLLFYCREGPIGRARLLIDLHCHLLPALDDGAPDLATAVEMARLSVADGVRVIACTPHIFPGVYNNSGPDIRRRVDWLRSQFEAAQIACRLVPGADVHIAPDLVAKLKSREALSLNDSRYVLIEPPHHVVPPNIDQFFFNLLTAGYVPILTHPERMTWAERDYDLLVRLVQSGTWMQLTAGSILGNFGARSKKLSERMLREGLAHIVASDAHDPIGRPPLMGEALQALRSFVGEEEALNLLRVRPQAILDDATPSRIPSVPALASDRYHDDGRSLSKRVLGFLRARQGISAMKLCASERMFSSDSDSTVRRRPSGVPAKVSK